MKVRVLYEALADAEGRWRTVGVLAQAGDSITYVALPEFGGWGGARQLALAQALARGLTAAEIFGYYAEHSNGVTEWRSEPETLTVPDTLTLEAAAWRYLQAGVAKA